ncbi:hypothetical protein [Cellulomonas bogoriensis]|uniref:Uncharacterized protein n=2 Tax=Cellulomonas bogoriensis TaxID=301388 RepID=A0A0A0BMU3_9CELL|nr:hypothetical protein N869_09825 [Cellulomonas bogoriensis 69B4 = DSM 16987]
MTHSTGRGNGEAGPWFADQGSASSDVFGGPEGDVGTRDGHGPGRGGPRHRSRARLWWLVAGAVALVAIVTSVVLLALHDPEPPPPLEPEVVTLPVPSPTVDPVEREEGTVFYQALPSTVLAYAVGTSEEDQDLLAAGALEGYRLEYTDGQSTLTLRAGQWAEPEATLAAFEELVEGLDQPDGEESPGVEDVEPREDAETTPEAIPDEGTVEVDGQEVGRYLVVPDGQGRATVVWTNDTVLISVEGPEQDVRDVFVAYPL